MSDSYRRIRAACCDESGLAEWELEQHALAIAGVVERSQLLLPVAWRFSEPPDDEPIREVA